MKPDKVLSMIGLATKAGKTASGEFCTEREVKTGRAALVIVAGDASDNTKRSFRTCVIFMKYRSVFIRIKIPWVMQWERSSGRLLPFWMRGLPKGF